jgi:lysophospholipid acyltransferase (LPLAT)-like uncharacterized protein
MAEALNRTPDAESLREYRRRRRRERGLLRTLRHRLRPLLSRPLGWLNLALFPPFYLLYMRMVWATSRIVDHGAGLIASTNDAYDGVVTLLWHEEVMTVAYGYAYVGLRPHTLASRSNDGDVITRLLERCGYVVFRGGSSDRQSRRRVAVTREMIDHMRKTGRVLYGFTVDGSKGPAYRMKRGGIVIARECGKPIVLTRTWYRRCIRLGTWDRTAIPLPFNTIHYYTAGPYFVPEDARTRAGIERFAQQLEDDLIALAARSYDDVGQARPANLRTREQERKRREAAAAPAT